MVAITTPLSTASGVNDIFIAENRYALVATTGGVDVIDMFCGQVISSGILSSQPLCVVADTTTASGQMYVGTSGAGIFSMKYTAVRAPFSDFTGSLVPIFSTTSNPPITGDEINDLAVATNRLFISTSGGVDFLSSHGLRAFRTLISGSQDCQLTPAGEAYWSVGTSGVEANYDLFPSSGTGIITVDFIYSSISTPALPSHFVNDLAVSPGSPNLLGFSTTAGAIIIEESQGSEASSSTKTFIPDNPVSIDFSPGATFNSGLVYIPDFRSLNVIGLVDDTVSGTHFHTPSLQDAEFNTGDQALVTGTITIVRTTSVP